MLRGVTVEGHMPTHSDAKERALRRDGAFNDQADAITDPLFRFHPFFDPRDRVQARYEMLRRHRVDGLSVSAAAAAFGVSRPTFYHAQAALMTGGLSGLVPQRSGPKEGHKLSIEVVAFVQELRTADPRPTMATCLRAVRDRFGLTVHRRSLERALVRPKPPTAPD
jgi:transposase